MSVNFKIVKKMAYNKNTKKERSGLFLERKMFSVQKESFITIILKNQTKKVKKR